MASPQGGLRWTRPGTRHTVDTRRMVTDIVRKKVNIQEKEADRRGNKERHLEVGGCMSWRVKGKEQQETFGR
jgi:hypothetical protein